jgi:hypothetical protein
MADLPISGLPANGALTGVEPIPAVQGGVTGKSTINDVMTFAAANLAGFKFPQPIIKTTNWISVPSGVVPVNVTLANDQFICHPIFIAKTITFDQIGCSVGTAIAATAVILGIYDDSGGAPNNLLMSHAGSISTVAAGSATATLTAPLVMTPGVYWLAMLVSGAPVIRGINGTDPLISRIFGATAPANMFSTSANSNGRTGTATFAGGLPNPFGGVASVLSNTPGVAIRMQ